MNKNYWTTFKPVVFDLVRADNIFSPWYRDTCSSVSRWGDVSYTSPLISSLTPICLEILSINTKSIQGRENPGAQVQHLGGGLCVASPMFPYSAGHRIRGGSQEYSSITGIKYDVIILSLFKSWLTQAELIIHAVIIFSVSTHAVVIFHAIVMFCVIIHAVIIFSVGIHTVLMFRVNIQAVLMCKAISPTTLHIHQSVNFIPMTFSLEKYQNC